MVSTHTGGPRGCQPPIAELDREAARGAINAATERFTALLREMRDMDRAARGTAWTVGETAAHVSIVLTYFAATIAGVPQVLTSDRYVEANFPTRLSAANTATIDMVDHTDAERLADMISVGAQRFLELAAAVDPDTECETPWYGDGMTRTVDCLTALALGELTVHGHDIANGAGGRWPVSAAHANLIIGTVCPNMSPLVVRPGAARGRSVTYEVRLRDNGPRYVIEIADGNAAVRGVGGPVDCVISADPATFLLVSYGRMPLYRALLRGRIFATGRRPWLALRFKSMFFNP